MNVDDKDLFVSNLETFISHNQKAKDSLQWPLWEGE